jgi:hypothetical protein
MASAANDRFTARACEVGQNGNGRNPPTTADFRTITDGPPSTQTSRSVCCPRWQVVPQSGRLRWAVAEPESPLSALVIRVCLLRDAKAPGWPSDHPLGSAPGREARQYNYLLRLVRRLMCLSHVRGDRQRVAATHALSV